MESKYYKTVNINTTKDEGKDTSILMIYTGGTIGMNHEEEGGSLKPFDFEQIIDKVPEIEHFDYNLTVLSIDPLIDSSDITPYHWIEMARLIEDNYQDFNSFVILHGTDTMAYSASALSFMLENLQKPVILTGSQLPIGATRTDARENLISALEMAAARDNTGEMLIREVCICFDNKLLRGNRSRKVQNFNFTAFKSYNYPALAEAGIFIEYQQALLWRSDASEPLKAVKEMDENVVVIKVFPGISKRFMEAILNASYLKGVILETYGSGNAPTLSWMTELLKNAIERGVVVVNISQCTGGYVLQGRYATGAHLEKIGVIGGGDMTSEAAVTKLMYLLAKGYSSEKVKKLMAKSLRGEISV